MTLRQILLPAGLAVLAAAGAYRAAVDTPSPFVTAVHAAAAPEEGVESPPRSLPEEKPEAAARGVEVAPEPRPARPEARSAEQDNPIPEFLRGRELPPVPPGKKVVTIAVGVEEWINLGWGDRVKVEYDEHTFRVVGREGSTVVADQLILNVVDHAEIYALPQIAPEKGETVPVCLTMAPEEARKVLEFRRRDGQFRLTVVEKFQPRPVPVATPTRDEGDVSTAETLPEITPLTDGAVISLQQGAVTLHRGQSVIVEFHQIRKVTGFDPSIVRVTAESARRLKLEALKPGETTLHVNSTVAPSMKFQVRVVESEQNAAARLRQQLRDLYPDADIQLVPLGDALLLRGTVATAEQGEQIVEVVEQFIPRVLNQLIVQSRPPTVGRFPGRDELIRFLMNFPVANPREELQSLRPGDRVAIAHKGRMILDDVEYFAFSPGTPNVVTLILNPDQAALLRSVSGELSVVVPRSARGREAPERSEAPARTPTLREEIRALHADVQALLDILRRRMGIDSEEGPLYPAPATPRPEPGSDQPQHPEAESETAPAH